MSSAFERLQQALTPADRQQGGRLMRYGFGAAFAVSAALTAFTIWKALTAPSSTAGAPGIVGPLHSVFLGLGLNLLLILGLAALVGWRVWKVFASREQDAGAKLHLRYMTLFALAAAVPAGVVALFFGVLVNQGMNSWFSDKIRTVVNNHREVARTLVDMQSERLTVEIGVAQKDINGYISDLRTNPARFNALLAQEAGARQFLWIYIVDREGRVLARAERPGAPAYAAPEAKAFAEVDANPGSPPTDLLPAADMARIVLRVNGDPPLYAVVGAPMPAGLLDRLAASLEAVDAYNDAEANRGRVQTVFLLSYLETALLVLVGAVWVGLGAANAIALPVARLVRASNRVAAGDLDARIEADPNSPEELEKLSSSFNRMTDDLQRQRKALKDASEEAEDRRQFIETVLGGVSAGVLGLDPEGRISACNSQAIRLLGLDPLLAQGMPLAEVAPELAPVLERAMTTGSHAEEDVDLLRSRETRHLRVRASGHASDGLVLTFDDITKLVSAQRNAAWKDVARRIAHEIKNPLTPIQLSAERLRRKYRAEITSDIETFDRCTDTIIRQVGDIGRMVDEFSAFARMPAPKFTTADAAELLREAVFARRVASPEIEIELEIKGEPGAFVCDDRMVAQALSNVLKNASEAIGARRQEERELKGHIIARLSGDRHNLIFEVQDNGVGLPDKDRARLTEPYVTSREKGTGLGLAIVKRILEDHAGQLFLRDPAKAGRKPVRGALVALQFPRGEPAERTKSPANTREDA